MHVLYEGRYEVLHTEQSLHYTEVLINADLIEPAQLSSVFSEASFSEVRSLRSTSHCLLFSSQYKYKLALL